MREIAFHSMWALQKECSDMLISYQQKGASKFRYIRCKNENTRIILAKGDLCQQKRYKN